MPRSAKSLSEKLISHLSNIEKTRRKSEQLLKNGVLVNRDVDIIYSGLYIDAVVSFERFIEELFIYLLAGKVIAATKKVKPKILFKSPILARNVMLGEKTYMDWLPYERFTKKRAKKFFKDGIPFTGLNSSKIPDLDKKIELITETVAILRNVLAHKSEHSFKRFQKEILDKTVGLRSKERTPTGYLRGIHSTHPFPITRYEFIINDIKFVSRALTSM